jgi:hypothetical protein
MQSDRHERISERAYHIWVAEGRGHGRHDEHWQRAEREIAEEELRVAAALADRAAGAAGTAKPRRPRQAASARPKVAAAKSPATRSAPARRGRRGPTTSASS